MSAAFRHEAVFYGSDSEYVAELEPFIREGVEAREPVLVAVPGARVELLRDALGRAARGVRFADMTDLGANPAWIIPAWREFVDRHGGGARPARGIGEPVWAGRSDAELEECHLHERLLNVAFADAVTFQLLCPYDTARLPVAVVQEARRSHPGVSVGGDSRPSPGFVGHGATARLLESPLPPPSAGAREVEFDGRGLADVRALAQGVARTAGLHADAAAEVAMVAVELATNSLRHGGGAGLALAWQDQGAIAVEVRDRGFLTDPLAGRRRPASDPATPRGLWLVHQLADLVQVRTSAGGTTVRAHFRRR